MKIICWALSVIIVNSISTCIAASDLTVSATIEPEACLLSFSNEGRFDYGKINAKNLSEKVFTILDERGTEFNIHCGQPTKVGFSLVAG